MADNNNLTAPLSGGSAAPWGVGFEWPGDYADLVRNNVIRNNVNFGILAFENPDPFPPTADTIYFQVSGNKFSSNKLTNNGTQPGRRGHRARGRHLREHAVGQQLLLEQQVRHLDPGEHRGHLGLPERRPRRTAARR